MSRIAGVPTELRQTADLARRAALEYAADSSYLSTRWLPSMPSGLAELVGSVTASAATELRGQAVRLVAEANDLDRAAYWFELAGDGSGPTTVMGILYGRDAALGFARDLLARLGADDDALPGLSSFGFADWLGVDPATASPQEVATAFAGMTAAQRDYLTLNFPEAIGNLDGAPLEMRFAANRTMIVAAVDDLEAEVAQARADLERMRLAGGVVAGPLGSWVLERAPMNPLGAAADRLAFLEEKLEVVRSWAADPTRRFLVFDPAGDGRVAEVFGEIETAEHVAILVPGMSNEIVDFDGLGANARRLMSRGDFFAPGKVATIAWLGYDTPTAKDVLFADKARAAAPLLDAFVDGLIPYRDVHYTVVAHSYGGVATGLSLKEGLNVDDVAMVGVPGTGPGIGNLSELGTDADVWAAKARFLPDLEPADIYDPGLGRVAENLGEIEFVPTFGAHGEDPTEESYGARRFRVNPAGADLEAGPDAGRDGVVLGHSEYFDPYTLSLDNLAHIMVGQDDLVVGY